MQSSTGGTHFSRSPKISVGPGGSRQCGVMGSGEGVQISRVMVEVVGSFFVWFAGPHGQRKRQLPVRDIYQRARGRSSIILVMS